MPQLSVAPEEDSIIAVHSVASQPFRFPSLHTPRVYELPISRAMLPLVIDKAAAFETRRAHHSIFDLGHDP
jgi:hypothetical protein